MIRLFKALGSAERDSNSPSTATLRTYVIPKREYCYEEGSFQGGGILEVAGIPGFLSNLNEFYEDSDAEGAQWRSFVVSWWLEYQQREVKAADLFQLIGDDVTLPLGDGSEQSRKVRLGQMLTQARDRTFNLEVPEGETTSPIELCIRRGDQKQRAYQWRLEEIDK